MLAIRPDLVRLDRLEPGDHRPLAEIASALRIGGVAAVSPSGVLGDPTAATLSEGNRLLDSSSTNSTASPWNLTDTMTRYRLDSSTKVVGDGTTVLGGSPLRAVPPHRRRTRACSTASRPATRSSRPG